MQKKKSDDGWKKKIALKTDDDENGEKSRRRLFLPFSSPNIFRIFQSNTFHTRGILQIQVLNVILAEFLLLNSFVDPTCGAYPGE